MEKDCATCLFNWSDETDPVDVAACGGCVADTPCNNFDHYQADYPCPSEKEGIFADLAQLRDKYKLDWDQARVVECMLQHARYGETTDLEAAIWHATRILNGGDDGE
jgi:hypothetical protein